MIIFDSTEWIAIEQQCIGNTALYNMYDVHMLVKKRYGSLNMNHNII